MGAGSVLSYEIIFMVSTAYNWHQSIGDASTLNRVAEFCRINMQRMHLLNPSPLSESQSISRLTPSVAAVY